MKLLTTDKDCLVEAFLANYPKTDRALLEAVTDYALANTKDKTPEEVLQVMRLTLVALLDIKRVTDMIKPIMKTDVAGVRDFLDVIGVTMEEGWYNYLEPFKDVPLFEGDWAFYQNPETQEWIKKNIHPDTVPHEYLDMTVCPDCNAKQDPPRDSETNSDCVNDDCESVVVKYRGKPTWTNPNWG